MAASLRHEGIDLAPNSKHQEALVAGDPAPPFKTMHCHSFSSIKVHVRHNGRLVYTY